jgi:hypothetical protein
MKLLTFYSDTHKELYEKFFVSSYNKHLKESFELIDRHVIQISEKGTYGSKGFEETMFEKITLVVDNIDIDSDEPLVFADCDIQFFGDFKEDIINDLGDKDISFQANDDHNICAGFFICKQNKRTLNFFKEVKKRMLHNMENGQLRRGVSDQSIMNQMFREGKYKLGKLNPIKYFTVAITNGPTQWNGGDFKVPKEVLMHHGNWTVGLENKFKIMEYVKKELTNGN